MVLYLLSLAKAKDMLEEVQNAEMMMNMTRDAADRAMMWAMDAVQRARNSSNRMDQLIQVSRDHQTQTLFVD